MKTQMIFLLLRAARINTRVVKPEEQGRGRGSRRLLPAALMMDCAGILISFLKNVARVARTAAETLVASHHFSSFIPLSRHSDSSEKGNLAMGSYIFCGQPLGRRPRHCRHSLQRADGRKKPVRWVRRRELAFVPRARRAAFA